MSEVDDTASADSAQSETLPSTIVAVDTHNDQEEQSPSDMDDSWVVIEEPASGDGEIHNKNAEATSEEGSNLNVDAVACAPSSIDSLQDESKDTAVESLEQVVRKDISSAEQERVPVGIPPDEQQAHTDCINELVKPVPTPVEEASTDSASDLVNNTAIDAMEVTVSADRVEDVSNDQEQGISTVHDEDGLELSESCSFEFIQVDSRDGINENDKQNNTSEGDSICVNEEDTREQVTSAISEPTLMETPQIGASNPTVEVPLEDPTGAIITIAFSENSEISSNQTSLQSNVIKSEPSMSIVSMDDVQDIVSVGNDVANQGQTKEEPTDSRISVDNQTGEADSNAGYKDVEVIPDSDEHDSETVETSKEEAGVSAVSLGKSQETEEDEGKSSSSLEVVELVGGGDSDHTSRAKELLAEVERKRLENQQKRDAVKGPRYVVHNLYCTCNTIVYSQVHNTGDHTHFLITYMSV